MRIVLKTNGTHSLGKDCYFPDENGLVVNSHAVQKALLQSNDTKSDEQIREFLERIGVRPFDDKAEIEDILRTWYARAGEIAFRTKTIDVHLDHMRHFIDFLRRHDYNENRNIFRDYCLFRVQHQYGDKQWRIPSEAYLSNSGLENYFSRRNLYPTINEYNSLPGFEEFAKKVGVCYELSVVRIGKEDFDKFRLNVEAPKTAKPPTSTGYVEDYSIEGLKGLLCESHSRNLALAVWNTMNKEESDQWLVARYKRKQGEEPFSCQSQLVQVLRDNAWIPQNNTPKLVLPANAYKEQLPPDFRYYPEKKWLEAVKFGEQANRDEEQYRQQNEQAQQWGFEDVDEAQEMAKILKEMKEQGKGIMQIRNLLLSPNDHFPGRTIEDQERFDERVRVHNSNASPISFVTKSRSIRESYDPYESKVYLREIYTNPKTGILPCQICQKPMPFSGRDGKPYFVRRSLSRHSKERFETDKEYEADHIALCPVCAAKFRAFVTKPEDFERIHRQLRVAPVKNSSGIFSISVKLDQPIEDTIRFEEPHIRLLHQIYQE